MKNLLIFISLFFYSILFAVDTVMVNDNASLAYPDKASFSAANNLVTNEVICVRVDMSGTKTEGEWFECELKVLDKNGNIVYFASTVWRDRSYHADAGVIDNSVKIYYYIAGSNSTIGVCAKPKKLLVQSGADDYSSGNSIYSFEPLPTSLVDGIKYANTAVTAIEFYPNMSGTLNGISIREIFLNPENSVIISRKNNSYFEKSSNQTRIWRPTIPQYYRTLP